MITQIASLMISGETLEPVQGSVILKVKDTFTPAKLLHRNLHEIYRPFCAFLPVPVPTLLHGGIPGVSEKGLFK